MPTWLDALVLSVTYLSFGWALWRGLYVSSKPPKLPSTSLLPGLEEQDLTSDTDYWGLYY